MDQHVNARAMISAGANNRAVQEAHAANARRYHPVTPFRWGVDSPGYLSGFQVRARLSIFFLPERERVSVSQRPAYCLQAVCLRCRGLTPCKRYVCGVSFSVSIQPKMHKAKRHKAKRKKPMEEEEVNEPWIFLCNTFYSHRTHSIVTEHIL